MLQVREAFLNLRHLLSQQVDACGHLVKLFVKPCFDAVEASSKCPLVAPMFTMREVEIFSTKWWSTIHA
jgi:hypothetical protein